MDGHLCLRRLRTRLPAIYCSTVCDAASSARAHKKSLIRTLSVANAAALALHLKARPIHVQIVNARQLYYYGNRVTNRFGSAESAIRKLIRVLRDCLVSTCYKDTRIGPRRGETYMAASGSAPGELV